MTWPTFSDRGSKMFAMAPMAPVASACLAPSVMAASSSVSPRVTISVFTWCSKPSTCGRTSKSAGSSASCIGAASAGMAPAPSGATWPWAAAIMRSRPSGVVVMTSKRPSSPSRATTSSSASTVSDRASSLVGSPGSRCPNTAVTSCPTRSMRRLKTEDSAWLAVSASPLTAPSRTATSSNVSPRATMSVTVAMSLTGAGAVTGGGSGAVARSCCVRSASASAAICSRSSGVVRSGS